MSQIRRQSIISSVMVYAGFALGFLNTYLFTKEGGFTKEQYGLTNVFIAIATLMFSFANLGMPSYIYKFYPYYNDNLDKKRNDILSWALVVSLIGFCFVTIGGLYFRETVIRKFGHSPELVKYYYWIFPFGLGLTLFSILESYAWQLKKAIVTNFLREVQFRLFTTILIVLTFAGLLTSFDTFIKIYSFTYLGIAFILLFYLLGKGYIHLTFTISIVTKKFYKKILALIGFVFGGTLVFAISTVFDSLVIAAVVKDGLAGVAIYSLAQNIASLIQAPQRGIISSSLGALSQAWKDKDHKKINRIYQRSSINQLIFSAAMFCLVWLNYNDAIDSFKLQAEYKIVLDVFLFMGLMRIVDMGTGVSGQIIATSTFWRFDFITGVILLVIMLPLNWMLTMKFGLIGPAIANLISFTIYNLIRYLFLLRKFNMQPFTIKSLLAILLAFACYGICYFLLNDKTGIVWMATRSLLFIGLFFAGTYWLDLTPDLKIVLESLKKRVRK